VKIQILEGVEGAKQATGTTVVIDVLRAATVSAYLLNQGVESILPVATAQEAFTHKANDPEILLVGENEGIKIEGFDIGNSPSEIRSLSHLSGKRVVHRSSTGTQGLVNATKATEIIFGSFVTTSAILNHIHSTQPETVTFVPMYALEDQLFAEYMQAKLLNQTAATIDQITSQLEKHEWLKQSFLNPDNDNFPKDDFYLSLEIDAFDFFPSLVNGEIVKTS